jgi:endo-1,4-beta-D-glucanase Y
VATESGNLEALEKIWEWANEKLKREEINNKLLLATDDKGRTVWHVVAESGNLVALQKIWQGHRRYREERLSRGSREGQCKDNNESMPIG